MRTQVWTLCLAALVGLVLAGCSGGSVEGNAKVGSGVVTFSLKDAPLSSMQTLTIDIDKATLHGIGGTSNYQVFPLPGQSGSINVDLLSLQGLAQLLSSASVPAGRYNKLVIDYTNPQGTDLQGNPQQITSQTGFFEGLFQPHLVVTPGSLQSVLIDVDLSNAYHDQGGNKAFLTAAIKLGVLSGTTPQPLQRFNATVLATTPAQDLFSADAFKWVSGASPVPLGKVDVQCDSNTVFNDGQGGITVGGVAALLQVNDLIEIEGALASGVINASTVKLISRGGGSTPPSTPPQAGICGTITVVDTVAPSVTVKVQWTVGYSATPYTDIVVNIQTTTVIHRGATALTLADLTRGNFCYVTIDPASGDTLDFEEAPAYVCGLVVSMTAGGGTGGADRVVFAPDFVSGVPVSQLPFVPSPLTVDLPAGQGAMAQVGFNFCVFAYFDGSATLVLGPGYGGSYTGTPPPAPSGSNLLSGALLTGTTASVNGTSVEFKLVAFDMATSSYRTFDVTVTSAAAMTLYGSAWTQLATAQDAADAINQNPNGVIEVLGNAPPSAYRFIADGALNIYATGPGGTPPTPGPGAEMALGFVTGPAVLTSGGDLVFTMQGATPAAPDWQVTVPAGTALTISGSTVTAAQALAALNATQAPFVQVEGTSSGTAFTGHVALKIFP